MTTESSPTPDLLVFATDWGFEGSDDQLFDTMTSHGFDGVEPRWPGDDADR